jgi:hypothetical protein
MSDEIDVALERAETQLVMRIAGILIASSLGLFIWAAIALIVWWLA